MIIFYQIPDDETAVRLRKIIEEDKIEHMYVEKEVAGQTIGALFAGDLTENPHHDPTLPNDPAVIFNAADTSQEEATALLDKFHQNDIVFGYPIYADDSIMNVPLGDVLVGHRDYQSFLNKLNFLQQMIDGCAALKEEKYDQDKWSDLKITLANANAVLEAIVSATDSEFDQVNINDIDKHIAGLQNAMKKLLG